MPRPKGDAEKKLLDAGLALSREKCCGAVSIRQLCRRARVNLGLFHYHFKSREAFRRRLLEAGYLEFFSRLSVSTEGPGRPPAKLRRALGTIARFAREHRRMTVGLIKDAINGDRQVARFAGQSFPRHLPLILGIYKEGLRSGDFRRLPEPFLLAFLLGTINVPGLMLTLLEEHGAGRPFGRTLPEVEKDLLSDDAIETRLDLVMAALAAARGTR